MKGKHANAAERRRYLEGLEKRAQDAERKAAKLEAELSELRTRTDAQIAHLRVEVADLKRQRDAAASPALDAALEDGQRLRRRIEVLKCQWAGGEHAFAILKRHASTALRNAGLSELEIQMVWTRAKNDIPDAEVGRITDLAVGIEDDPRGGQ